MVYGIGVYTYTFISIHIYIYVCVCVNSHASASATCCAQIAFRGLEQSCECLCNICAQIFFSECGSRDPALCLLCGCGTMAAADDAASNGVAEATWLEPKQEPDEDWGEPGEEEEWGDDGAWYEDVGTKMETWDGQGSESWENKEEPKWEWGSSSDNDEGWWKKHKGYNGFKNYDYKTVKKDKWPKNYQQMSRSSSSDSQGNGRYVPNGFIRDGIFYPSLVAI